LGFGLTLALALGFPLDLSLLGYSSAFVALANLRYINALNNNNNNNNNNRVSKLGSRRVHCT